MALRALGWWLFLTSGSGGTGLVVVPDQWLWGGTGLVGALGWWWFLTSAALRALGWWWFLTSGSEGTGSVVAVQELKGT